MRACIQQRLRQGVAGWDADKASNLAIRSEKKSVAVNREIGVWHATVVGLLLELGERRAGRSGSEPMNENVSPQAKRTRDGICKREITGGSPSAPSTEAVIAERRRREGEGGHTRTRSVKMQWRDRGYPSTVPSEVDCSLYRLARDGEAQDASAEVDRCDSSSS